MGELSHVSLATWVNEHHSEEELRTVFLNLDRALKYIHDHNYCIEVFYPTEIEILNNEVDHIQFKHLMELSHDPVIRSQMIKEDIFNSAFLQIGIYSNCLKSLTPQFLRENFDAFCMYIPEGDSPYYRGVVQRNAAVYFCEFAVEKRNRELKELESQLGDKSIVIPNNNDDITNNKVNDKIYRQINGLNDNAFISWLVIPTVILIVLILVSILFWLGTFIL